MSSRIEVLHGRFVDPLNLNPVDVQIEDIAHALSNQCRFSGYTSRHYSVAEHSVYVARLVAMKLANKMQARNFWSVLQIPTKRRIVRQALLHDAPEAYLTDLARPVKHQLPGYMAIEAQAWGVLAEVFDVDVEMHAAVKEADYRICANEKLAFLSPHTDTVEWREYFQLFPPYEGNWDIIDRYEVTPRQARRRFLDFYRQVANDGN